MKTPVTAIILALFFNAVISSAQTISMPDNTSYPCSSMSFPVTAGGFPSNMGAVTLIIETNPAVLTYTGHTPGVISGYGIGYNSTTGTVTITKWSEAGFSINGTMLTLNFTYSGGACPVAFDQTPPAMCEFTTIDFTNIVPSYDNGSAGPVPRTNYFVDYTKPAGGDGLSWATAFNTITAATNAALNRGDHVTIKPGTYNEAVVIKSNGTELVPLKTGVTVTDTNTLFFPTGTSLSCIDPGSYPDEIFLYLYRSMKGNNGVYEVQSVNPATRMVTLKGAKFITESGVVGDTSQLQAAIGHAIVYRKDTTLTSALIVSASGVAAAKAVCYIGNPIGGGDDATPANYNILDRFDLTGIGAGNTGRYGLRIQGSRHNVFMRGKIYECDSVGILVSGNTEHPAKRNIIFNNTIYNISKKGLKIGKEGMTAANNRVHHTIFSSNRVYSTGIGENKGFYTMAETQTYTSHSIIEKNIFRSFSFQIGNRGAIQIGTNSPNTVVAGNYLRNITDALAGVTNAYIFIRDNSANIKVFNNVMVTNSAANDDIFAFRLNAAGHTGTFVVYNTVHNVDKGVFFEDSGVPVPVFNFKNNILNVVSGDFYFTHSVTGGRFSVSNNCYAVLPTQSGGTYYFPDATSVVGNPQFLLPTFFLSAYGFSVKTGSICKSAGTPVTGILVDYMYASRNATTPTIGAFENTITSTAWNGKTSTDWHEYSNWSPEIVPFNLLQAIIPNKTNDPVITNSNGSCKGIEIQSGASVIVNSPRTLTINN